MQAPRVFTVCKSVPSSLTQLLQGVTVSQEILQVQRHVVTQLLHGAAPEAAGRPFTRHLKVVQPLSCHDGGPDHQKGQGKQTQHFDNIAVDKTTFDANTKRTIMDWGRGDFMLTDHSFIHLLTLITQSSVSCHQGGRTLLKITGPISC